MTNDYTKLEKCILDKNDNIVPHTSRSRSKSGTSRTSRTKKSGSGTGSKTDRSRSKNRSKREEKEEGQNYDGCNNSVDNESSITSLETFDTNTYNSTTLPI